MSGAFIPLLLPIHPTSLITPPRLIPPIPLHKISRISSHPGEETLRPKKARRPSPPHTTLPLHPQLNMQHPQHKKCSHSIIQYLPVRTIQFRDRRQCEGEGHAFDEIGLGAGIEEEGVRIVV